MNEVFRSRLVSASADELVRAIVCYTSQEVQAAVQSARLAPSVRLGQQYSLIPAQAVLGRPKDLLAMVDSPGVETMWEDLPVHTMLDVSVPHIKAPQLWHLDHHGTGIKVAVVDTGIDPEHPDFEDRLLAIKDFTSPSGRGRDGNGHGTHVASIAAGSGAASGGRYIGVAPEAQLLVAKVLRDDGSGMTSDVMAGVEWAVEQGAQVVNLSLGADVACDGTDALSALCDAAVAQGVVVCVAAGNAGPGSGTVGSPGCARQVITVGATTDADQVTIFSSRGPTKDGRVKPDLCFPGNNIVAARAKGTALGAPQDSFYTSASGTSMATPHAAGAVALLLEAYPDLAPAQVKGRLKASAVDLNEDANTQGSGRGDVLAAYQYEGQPEPEPGPEPTPGGCLFPTGASIASGTGRELWWVLGLFVLVCVCVSCAAGTLIALGLIYG